MVKKLIGCLLCVVLLLCSVSVFAETTTDRSTVQEQMPFTQEKRPGRDDMGGGMQPPQMPEGVTPGERPQMNEETVPPSTEENAEADKEMIPPTTEGEQTPTATETTETKVDYTTLLVSLGLLAVAFLFVIFYKRKQY